MEADDLLKVPVLGDVVKVGCDFLVRHSFAGLVSFVKMLSLSIMRWLSDAGEGQGVQWRYNFPEHTSGGGMLW